ncbi:unnamed protein product [Gordionus sp. m RMFG-2023]|uniref:mediator of RNA polymerase II transcription subunit 4-like isoform X2 n=1 Tax=Gordionus sp. m RMFG-2023 TaxID=3053472 RepID=UPI0030DE86F9
MINIIQDITIKDQLLSYVADIENIVQEIIKNILSLNNSEKNGESTDSNCNLLSIQNAVKKLVVKENIVNHFISHDLKNYLNLKNEIDKLQQEYDNINKIINEYILLLKKSEEQLAASIYKAKEKLKLIDKSEINRQKPEFFIKYAHSISAFNSIVAPNDWSDSDINQRPFLQDLEMRYSFLNSIKNPSSDDKSKKVFSYTSATYQHILPTPHENDDQMIISKDDKIKIEKEDTESFISSDEENFDNIIPIL